MLVRDLIDELMQYDGDTEVRIAHQPSWPFEYSISEVVPAPDPADDLTVVSDDDGWYVNSAEEGTEVDGPFGTHDEADARRDAMVLAKREAQGEAVVYIAEGSQLGYLPGAAAQALGWR